MHWVDRGPEPGYLAPIRAQYTDRWVRHYWSREGKVPNDSHWRQFLELLDQRFLGICAYCEEYCSGEVDHFRPKSKFPHLVYEWSNWLFACHDCNHAKSGKWPSVGYVDPCARICASHPERFFTFDLTTGEILPREDLTSGHRARAQNTIDDLKLNARHHLKSRTKTLTYIEGTIPTDPDDESLNIKAERQYLESRETELSSFSRAWLSKQGYVPTYVGALEEV